MKYWDIIWVTKLQYPAELWLSLSALWRTPIFDTFLKIEFGKGCGSMMTPLHATTIGVNFELSIRLSQSSISQIIFTVLTNTNSDQIKGKTWWREHHTAMPVYLHKYCHYSSYLVITFCCIIIHHSIIGSKHHYCATLGLGRRKEVNDILLPHRILVEAKKLVDLHTTHVITMCQSGVIIRLPV